MVSGLYWNYSVLIDNSLLRVPLFDRSENNFIFEVFFCRHMWRVTLVTMQCISDDNVKNLCRCYQVRTDLGIFYEPIWSDVAFAFAFALIWMNLYMNNSSAKLCGSRTKLTASDRGDNASGLGIRSFSVGVSWHENSCDEWSFPDGLKEQIAALHDVLLSSLKWCQSHLTASPSIKRLRELLSWIVSCFSFLVFLCL